MKEAKGELTKFVAGENHCFLYGVTWYTCTETHAV